MWPHVEQLHTVFVHFSHSAAVAAAWAPLVCVLNRLFLSCVLSVCLAQRETVSSLFRCSILFLLVAAAAVLSKRVFVRAF